jgi:two-component sensor histidine kinase
MPLAPTLRRATDGPDAPALLEAVRAAALLGWLSVVAVLVGLAIGLPVAHDELVLGTTVVAAIGHAGLGLLPWARLLPTARGRLLLNLWSAALVAGVCGLVLTAGGSSRLDLLFFLVVPFLAMVHDGRRLALWLAAAAATYVASTLLTTDPLPRPELVLHGLLLVASGALGLQLAGAIRRQTVARVEAIRRAELEGAMLAEGHHRVKNSLQVVADLLLLGRPDHADGPDGAAAGAAFDHAAARIRSIAAVHDVLAERRGGRVPADELLRAVVDAAHPGATTLDVDPVTLVFGRAQNLGVVVNELVTNAHEHGRGTVAVRLRHDAAAGRATLEVRDAGPGPSDAAWADPGLGLRLVRQVVEQGLRGRIDRGDAGVVTVRFSTDDDAHPGR